MIPAIRNDVREPFAQEAADGEMDFTDLEETLFARGNGHEDL